MNKLDSPKTTIERREIIYNKKYLKKTYLYFYNIFKNHSKDLPRGKKIEIGSGAGFLKDIIPDVITSDIMKLPFSDYQFKAENIPFKNNSISVFYLLNTFHHIKNPKKAFSEMERCLKRNGKIIMVEPANTPFSRFIYKNFHHERFDENGDWKISGNRTLSDSNQALPWIVFVRDKKTFLKLFSSLRIVKYKNHTPLNYLISGGFKYSSILPDRLFSLVSKLENKISFLNNHVGLFSTIIIKKV